MRTFAILNTKGGVGKPAPSINLASLLSATRKEFCGLEHARVAYGLGLAGLALAWALSNFNGKGASKRRASKL